ncbi:MAG TPA: methyltransferase [Candidatus Nanoarchaeia archaeon]|nr:methyltransferase [Candidatus Nanoarchaeia archaeon]
MIKKIIIDQEENIHYYKKGDFHSHFGFLKEKDITEGIVKSNLGKEFIVFDASFIDNIHQIKRGPAISHPKDIGTIIATTGVGVKSKVVDAGSGCANLALSLARIGCDVTTYEINQQHHDIAKHNIENINKKIKIKNKDIYKGIDEKNLDLVMLDLPEPWQVLEHAHKKLKSGGFLVAYLPTIIQVSQLVQNLKDKFYLWKVSETLEREWHVAELRVRPKNQMLGHTAFLVFARKI